MGLASIREGASGGRGLLLERIRYDLFTYLSTFFALILIFLSLLKNLPDSSMEMEFWHRSSGWDMVAVVGTKQQFKEASNEQQPSLLLNWLLMLLL